jgi:hypothetical protein
MKRIFTTIALALTMGSAFAQGFWTPTTYKGAFDCSAPMWTNGWTEWDPQNKVYPANTMTVSSNITTNTTWTTGQTVLLQGQIYVKNNSVLTIQPGVVIKGSSSVAGSGLFITTGSQIQAVGTVSMPIVFTSEQPVGARTQGDWGGVILMGLAPLNFTNGINNIEGIAPSPDTQYGGGASPNANDNSGTLKYVRIEYAGYVYAANKEINSLTMGAVGKGTSIDYVQCSFGNDDGFEWFGGNVDCKHLISYRNLDDDFDTDNGYSGNVQFGLIVRDPSIADNPAVSTSEGFESDNDAGGTTATPQTKAVFSNITAIGPYRGSSSTSIASGYKRALRIRRNSSISVFNSLFMDFKTGIMIDGSLSEGNATANNLNFRYNVIATTSGVTPKTCETVSLSTFPITSWFATSPNDSLTSTAGILVQPYNYTSPDYRPVCSNTVTNGANFGNPAFQLGGVLGVQNIDYGVKYTSLFPNPSTGNVSLLINTENDHSFNVNIYSVTGQLIATPHTNHPIGGGVSELPLNVNLPSGIYFVSVQYGNKTENLKLVVNN